MDAERIEVLHGGNGETVIVGVADDLKLNLLPSFQRLFHQHLWRKGESRLGNLLECLLVGADA